MQIKPQHPNSFFFFSRQLYGKCTYRPLKCQLLWNFICITDLSINFPLHRLLQSTMYGCMICALAPQPSYRFTHLVVHSACIYSSSTWFSWSFRMASIGFAHSWNTTAPNWWAVKSVTLYKYLDKTFQLQPSETAAEKAVNYCSCKELLN